MDTLHKLGILSDSAKYDVACTSSGTDRKKIAGGIGNATTSGICHSFSADGRCISLLKILMSNSCIYDCAYCINRSSNDVPRATFTPAEVIDLTIGFYKRNYIEGLFLSSAVIVSPNHTMELITQIVRSLRVVHRFNGYIHIKAIPGADSALIDEAGRYADRMSVNIELPTSDGLKLLAPQKKREAILGPMDYIHRRIEQGVDEGRTFNHAPKFVPAGQSTQLIVGATPDHDLGILRLSEALYNKYRLRRVFYSAYVPVSTNPLLPVINKPPLIREHRLYQADWLLRFYGFNSGELLNERTPDFDLKLDPKSDWALRNMDFFPLEVNKASYEELLRVPGIGLRSAKRILQARRMAPLNFDNIKKLGVVMKRACFFILCQGRQMDGIKLDALFIRANLLSMSMRERFPEEGSASAATACVQMSIFGEM